MAAMEANQDQLRADAAWLKAHDWDRFAKELRTLEAKLAKKEADMFSQEQAK